MQSGFSATVSIILKHNYFLIQRILVAICNQLKVLAKMNLALLAVCLFNDIISLCNNVPDIFSKSNRWASKNPVKSNIYCTKTKIVHWWYFNVTTTHIRTYSETFIRFHQIPAWRHLQSIQTEPSVSPH